ncbi:hypothetical protein HXX76_015785 [Chlamydomonas incerta]|uniref:Uncharacterized protein n=1 Tax=Chlamydomonas incerta TaxID=51695 RepID=A0A835SLS8_CHLIN|nr:hypothetical protein HXX76_015785 [Chlamydomonas incerta]|eukprot:KAG2422765.1 hypothetical protein HXX76_015785 [Chlamydomonas incerta]
MLHTRHNMSMCGDGNAADTHAFVPSDRCVEEYFVSGSSQHCRLRELQAAASQGSWSKLQGNRTFIAVTFHNNQEILPTFFFELLRLVLTLREAFGGDVFVSVYESGSTDLSAFELIQFRLLLERARIPHEVVTRGITRMPTEHRIDFLAKVRNLSIKPLLTGRREYDTVLFINDVYFCAQSALDVLLMRAAGADMVCSADFYRNEKGELAYYDIWVSRDLHGRKFRNSPPYIGLEESWQRFQARSPVPVYSCWGGMAAVAGSAFGAHGIRFRRNFPTECAASECELLCRDLWGAGLSKIILLPTATTAYAYDVFISAQQRYTRPSEPLLEMPTNPRPPVSVECCPLEDSCEAIVDFGSCVEDTVTWFYGLYGMPASPGGMAPMRLPGPRDPNTITMPEVVAGLQPGNCSEVVAQQASKRIPRRIVQTWKTSKPAEVRQHVWFLALSWVLRHPCYEYQLVTDAEIEPVIRGHELYPLWKGIASRGMKNDFGRYLYLYTVGGIYADLDTYAVRPLEELIRPEDEFVVGLEAAFAKKDDAVRWAYAVATSASLHCFAASPQSQVLAAVLKEVSHRLKTPVEVYKRLLQQGSGSPAFLETLFTTGPSPFSEVVLGGHVSFVVRLLDVHAFSGGHVMGEEFYRLQDPKHTRNRTVYVEHRNYGSWVPKRHTDDVETSFHYLPANRPLLQGEWFYGADLSRLRVGEPTWSSVEASVSVLGHHHSSRSPPFFVWLSAPDDTDVSCLHIMRGLGPRDPENRSVWKVCWDARAEEDVTYLWLHPDGALNVYTASRSWCACEPPAPPRSLWTSSPGKDGLASVLLLNTDGVLSVFQFASGYVMSRAVGSLGLGSVSSSKLSEWQMVADARGSCDGMYLVSREGRETVPSLEAAMRMCEQEDTCAGFTYALPSSRDAPKGLWMCTKSVPWHPAPDWVTVSRAVPSAASTSSMSACYIAHVDASCDKFMTMWEKLLLRMRFC